MIPQKETGSWHTHVNISFENRSLNQSESCQRGGLGKSTIVHDRFSTINLECLLISVGSVFPRDKCQVKSSVENAEQSNSGKGLFMEQDE